MNKINDIVDYGLITLGSVYSIENIEQILGVLLLCVQLVWLIIKLGFKVYHSIKNQSSDLTEGDTYIEDFKEEIDDFLNKNEVISDDEQP